MGRQDSQMDARGAGDANAPQPGRANAPVRPRGLVGASNREEASALVRRFSRQTVRVRAVDGRPLAGLDMDNAAGQDPVSPQRLGSHLERLYMSFLVDCFCFQRHVVRLRSWRERPRTLSFLAVYTAAWLVDLVAPTLTAFLIILIIYPPARALCFPPLPPPATPGSRAGGGAQKSLAGELAPDPAAAAPVKRPGMAEEQSARDFATNVGQFGANAAKAQNLHREDDLGKLLSSCKVLEEILLAQGGFKPGKEGSDQDSLPVLEVFEIFPAIRMLPNFLDNWERLRNALRPTSPFPLHRPRLILASCLLPVLIILCLVTWHGMMKVLGFLVGLGFFGGPLVPPCLGCIDSMFPGWRECLQLRHTLLRGVPTNAQLTIALLRSEERTQALLLPAPDKGRPTDRPGRGEVQDLDHGGIPKDDAETTRRPELGLDGCQDGTGHRSKPMGPRRLANTVRRCTKIGVRVLLKVDEAKAMAGNSHAKARLGALEAPGHAMLAGPLQFPARYRGEKGYAYMTRTAPKPTLSWRREKKGSKAAWTVAVADITEIRKVGGLGWKCKLVVEAVLGWQVLDGLVVRTREGRELHLTAIGARDEVFNRLISIGSQAWEMF